MLVWKDEYSIGVDLIDKQHKYLFDIGNNAYKLMSSDFSANKYDDIVIIIQDLRQYTKFHFMAEEEYMIKTNCKEYVIQKLEHDEFINKLDKMNLELVDEDPQKLIEDILAFIFDWLLSHILLKDKLIKTE